VSYVFTEAKRQYAAKTLGLGDDFRWLLVMTGNTLNTAGEEDELFLSGLVLDEFDGVGYARVAALNESVVGVAAANAAMFDADDPSFGVLANGTRQIDGAVLYKHVGADSANVPVAFYDDAPFPLDPAGTELILRVNINGLLRFT
jgi:hypothetical protein